MNVLVWLKRDLRLDDHPALALAAGIGPVLPVYLVEPRAWAEADASARQWDFVAESLADLREALAGVGLPLIVRVGEAVEVLDRLCRQHRIARIVSHAGHGTPFSRARDAQVAAWARGAGIEWTELSPDLEPPPMPPALAGIPGVEPGLIPTARALKLAPDPCPHRQLGGRTRGLELLESFLSRRGEAYRTARHSPLAAERASSRLSPHLAWGTLSPREVALAVQSRRAERPGPRWTGALTAFQAQLALRDMAALTTPCGEGDPARLQTWLVGETGLPFLDATMRYLRSTGWLNQRMRGMAAGAARHLIGLGPQEVGAGLARLFTDYDPGLLWPEIPGDGLAVVGRPCNPVAQGQALDPTGAFTRRWLPELALVPDAFLQTPWKWPEAHRLLGKRYPEPVVDPASATRAARDRIWRARRMADFAAPAATMIRHSRHRLAPTAQLTLDF